MTLSPSRGGSAGVDADADAEAEATGPIEHRVVVGTAGHVDHGKTRLLEALTGVDCDRWSEEKERGITIDLGFAHRVFGHPTDGDLQIGFVDVPGHERFLHNALAGLGGIRLVLLVVAADEGVMPQTREHLAICELLDVPDAVVAMTKRDLVDDDTASLARLELEEELRGGPFEGAPIVEVSAVTGDGIDALASVLVERSRRAAADVASHAEPSRPFRLPIDRAFQLQGLGTVVTGSPVSGRVESRQSLEILPADRPTRARVRAIQVHDAERSAAVTGERTALQLGGVDAGELARGQQLVTPEIFAAGATLLLRARLLELGAPRPGPSRSGGSAKTDAAKLESGWTDVRVHLYADDVPGRARSLGAASEGRHLLELRLARPVVAVRGDRVILRRPSPAETIGGGVVLDPRWRRRSNREAARRAARALDCDDLLEGRNAALETWVRDAGPRGLDAADVAARLGVRRPRAESLLGDLVGTHKLLRLRDRFVHPQVVQELVETGKARLAEFFRAERLAPGMPKAELVERLLPRDARGDADTLLRWLAAAGVLRVDGDLVNPPGRRVAAELSGEESDLSRRLLSEIEAAGLTPPSPPELARRLEVKPQILDGVQRYLVSQKRLVRLPSSGLIVSTRAVERLRDELHATGWDSFSIPEFKERWDLSRKWAIPLLEHLDSLGVTRRLGDRRQVVRGSEPGHD